MGMITGSDAISNDTVSLSVLAGASTAASLASSAPIRGPTLQVVLDSPQSFSLPSPPDDQFPQEPAVVPYNGIAFVSTGAIKGTGPSIKPTGVVSSLPTPPLTPETPAKFSPADPTHFASLADAWPSQSLSTLKADDELEIRHTRSPHGNARSNPLSAQ